MEGGREGWRGKSRNREQRSGGQISSRELRGLLHKHSKLASKPSLHKMMVDMNENKMQDSD